MLSTALELHQAGQLAAAMQLYRSVLAQDPDHADALHMLGVAHHQQGDHVRAVESIGRAVALRPSVPAFHSNLSEAYRAIGQFDRAIGCCRAALRLWPDYLEAFCNYGLALQGKGRQADAAAQFRRALELRPDFAPAHNNLGVVLRELGEFDQALEHFRKAVELDSAYGPAQSNLGQMLVDRGQAEEALPHCQEAVRLQPDNAALHHNLGNALRELAKPVEARAAYLEALRLSPDLAITHAHLGLVLQREGKFDEALIWLKQAVELEPQNALLWQHLAELYQEMEEPADAIPCWQRVLFLTTNHFDAQLGLGWALHDEGRLDEARLHYQRAIELRPDSGMAQINLGGLHEERGDLAAAEAVFRNGLRVQPRFALPHGRLATLLRGDLPDADLAALEERIVDPDLAEGPRARLLFALAHVLDARGEFPRAAECLREANAIALRLDRERREYDPNHHAQFVDAITRAFDADFFVRLSGQGLDARQPVFVFGLPRSGTTLVEQVLASHSQIHGAGELRLVRKTFEGVPAATGRNETPRDCVRYLDGAAARTLADSHLEKLQTIGGSRAARIIDKMPDNYLYLGLLSVLFPRATLIHCRRDLRDVALSCWMTDFRSIRWANDTAHLAARIHQYCHIMDHWSDVLPSTVHVVDYEQTICDFETVARRLVAACGLEWEPACLEFHRTQRTVRTASLTQVRQPIYRRAVARWKNYQNELAELFASLPPAPA